jgi:O-acetyl-ADP-ribose deacetylase (regulator of RNase III)
MFVTESGRAQPRWLIGFPTKQSWRSQSKLADIERGLVALVREIDARAVRSIATPALGCGLGGLDWRDVRPAIERAFSDSHTTAVLFGPRARSPASALLR